MGGSAKTAWMERQPRWSKVAMSNAMPRAARSGSAPGPTQPTLSFGPKVTIRPLAAVCRAPTVSSPP